MSNLVPFTGASRLKAGEVHKVGEFFWCKDVIGVAPDWHHGHGSKEGSADEKCSVQVVRNEGDGNVIVKLLRPKTPYGALAPIGLVFKLSEETILSWPAIIAEKARKVAEKKKLMDELIEGGLI